MKHIPQSENPKEGLIEAEGGNAGYDEAITERLVTIQRFIADGAKAFLGAEYKILFWFILFFGIFIFVLLGPSQANMDYHEIGRSISTLMSDKVRS